MHPDIVCSLDIGASSIRAMVLRLPDEKILGFSESPAKGFSKGVVTNLGLLSDAIEDAVSKVEASSHCKVRKLVANISGMHIRTFKSRGSVHISDRPSEITQADIKRCIASAKLIAMSLDREMLYLAPERFYIDDKLEIDEPLGLFGSKLDIDLNIITSLVSILQNITKAINLAGYEAEDIIISGQGTALAVFDDKQLKEGVVIIDVGKDLTEACLFTDGKLRDCFYFPFGGDDLTLVLQDKLGIMFEEADELRIRYGNLAKDNQELYDEDPILIPSLRNMPGSGREDTQFDHNRTGGNWVDSEALDAGARLYKKDPRPNVISRREIFKLLSPKVEEIMQDVYKKIGPFLKKTKRIPHISITGGLSKMDGFIEAVQEIFSAPVDMARIRDTKDLHEGSFACCLGLARFEAQKRAAKKSKYTSRPSRLIARIRSLLSEYF